MLKRDGNRVSQGTKRDLFSSGARTEEMQVRGQSGQQIKHQLNVWLQCRRELDHVVLSYSYPYSRPHELREQRLNLKVSELEEVLRAELHDLIDSIASQILRSDRVRLPHTEEVPPSISYGYFTLAIQDQKRPAQLPACGLYYYEEITEMPSKVEREVRLQRDQLSKEDLDLARRVGAKFRKMAWQDYEHRFGKYFRD